MENLKSDLQNISDLNAAIFPLQQKVREHMSKTRILLARVYVSFDRLARLAPTLTEDSILVETTNTLDLYAEYRQHLSSDEYVSYPPNLKVLLANAQGFLVRIFLDLQINKNSRTDPKVAGEMNTNLKSLQTLKEQVSSIIEEQIRIKLPPIS